MAIARPQGGVHDVIKSLFCLTNSQKHKRIQIKFTIHREEQRLFISAA